MEKQIQYKQTTIKYPLQGSGKAVMLLHGFGEDSSVLAALAHELAKNHLVINLDLPGCGVNAKATELTNFDDCIEIIESIVNTEQWQQFTILGHSMGGYIALHYAKKYTIKLNGIGLLHSTIFADDETKLIARNKNIDFIQTHGSQLFLKQTTPNLFAKTFVVNNAKVVNELIDKMSYISSKVLTNYTKAMMGRKNSTEFATTTQLPLLYIIGTEDNAVPLPSSLAQCHLPKTSYFHILNGVGHMGMMETPLSFVNTVKKFLDELG